MSRRPQPVLSAAQATAVTTWITALVVGWLARHGWLLPDTVAEDLAELVELAVVAAAGTTASLLTALAARRRVTPIADPRDDDGVRLIRLRPPPPASRPAAPPATADTAQIRLPVDVAALRREYHLD